MNRAVLLDSGTSFAVGDHGTILKSTDAGASWTMLRSGTTSSLHGVSFFDPNDGVTVGDSGLILRTTDGGGTWQAVASGVSDALRAVSFSGVSGICGGDSQTILNSGDSGASWCILQSGLFGGSYAGAQMKPTEFFMAGQNSILQPLLTSGIVSECSGGWGSYNPNFDNNEGLCTDVFFFDPSIGFVSEALVDGRGAISRTTGSTLFYEQAIEGITFPAPASGFAVGFGGRILHTTDFGVTWYDQSSGTSANLNDVSFTRNGLTGIAVGEGGTIVRTTNGGGPPTTLGNISTRAFVQTGDNVVIGGFIVQGAQTKRVIIRAIGPELTRYGVPNALTNPILELHDRTGDLIASNDNWHTTIIGGVITSNQVGDITNSGYAPSDWRESAIIADLPPDNYTAIVRGVNDMTGVALVEVYGLGNDAGSILGNISTRALVQTGNDVMIGGFIVQETGPKTVIVRAIGPELTPFGIPNALADPTLELHNGTGALIASNDNWQTTVIGGIITSNQVSAIQNSGHAPTQPSESAIIATLQPGHYTAIVRGKNNTTGVALVEVYDLQ